MTSQAGTKTAVADLGVGRGSQEMAVTVATQTIPVILAFVLQLHGL